MTTTSTKQQGRKLPTLLLLLVLLTNSMAYARHNPTPPTFSIGQKVESLNSFVDESLEDRAILEVELSHQTDYSFHLFSHGQPSQLLINNNWLSGDDLVAFIQPLLKGKTHLNIYGCHFAQGEKGRAAVAYLETALGITVAASDDLTGVDGDWDLEVGNFKNGVTIQEYPHNLQQGTLPIQPGMAATTCGSFTVANQFHSDPTGYVFGIFDIRDPGCAGTPGANAPNAPANWAGAGGSNAYHDPRWTNENLGEVFGVDLEYDQASSPDIFLSSGGLTNIGTGTNPTILPMVGGTGGEVFRIDGTTGDITVVATLPNHTFIYNPTFANSGEKYVGLGNLSYNAIQKKLYVTNLEDGNIYVVDATTTSTIDQVYDPTPGSADDTNLHYTQRERMVYGIEYNKCNGRVYYSRPNGNGSDADIFSVGLNADGTIDNVAPVLHHSFATSVPEPGDGTEGAVVSDIEFSDDCTQMLTSERELRYYDTALSLWAHHASVQMHDVSGATWTTGVTYDIGTVQFGAWPHVYARNAGGGVSFGYSNYGSCDPATACSDAMVATGDALVFDNDAGTYMYGLQISDLAGTSSYPTNSYFIDLDGNTGVNENYDKFTNYDVDVFGGSECSAAPCSIDADGLGSVSCTGTNAITFSLTPTGTSTSAGGNYNVTVSGGGATSISPTSGTYGAATTFTLNNNSAGGGNVTVTISDGTESSCTRNVTVADPGTCLAPCSLSMSQTSTCSESGGVYTQTYDLTLNWIGAPATGDLTITLTGDGTLNTSSVSATTLAGGSTTTLPGAFTIPADGNGTTTITATFDDENACTSTFTLKAPVPCPADVNPCASTAGCIGGKVFEDFNCNGADDADAGVQGVQIQVYDCNNTLVGTGYSDSDGDWQVCGLTDGDTYRIESVLPESVSCWASLSHVGTDNGSSVQFAQPGSCTDFALVNPLTACFNPTAEKLMTTCFTVGDPLTGGINATDPTIINFNFAAATLGDAKTSSATAEQTGSVWGLAYTKQTDVLYMAAMLKRHSGLGPNGLGAIYSASPYSSSPSLFYDLSAHVSVGTIPDNPSRGLSSNLNDASHDVDAFNKVGKVGIGDIDITPDGSTLYVVNLFDKLVYAIDIANPSAAPLALPALPAPGCINGEARPWGLKYHNGALYASLTCTAENGGTRDDLEANVYKYNGTSWSASILQIPLNFSRGCANWASSNSPTQCNWNPWVDDWVDFGGEYSQPSPILSDIEFDDEGNMILGFIDRTGHQLGHWNYSTDVNSTTTYRTNQGGDILKAHNNSGTYVLENNGTVGGQTASGSNTNGNPWNGTGGPNSLQGPGGGEFFWADYLTLAGNAPAGSNEEGQHSELASGGLAISAADNIVLSGAMDPNGYDEGGVIWLDNTNGSRAYGLTLYAGDNNNNLFGKATGIGDVEAIISCAPLPLEIGNYVWCDSLENGIQDACERGISDILVQLYDRTGALVGQDTTVNGQYYFNQNNVDTTGINVDGSGIASAVTAWSGMSYSTQYFIVFGGGQFTTDEFTVGSQTYGITAMANTGSNDNIDSDVDGSNLSTLLADMPAGLPFIDMTTSATGCGDHKYDLGVTCSSCEVTAPVIAANQSICDGENPAAFTVSTAATGNGTLTYQWQSSTTDCTTGFTDIGSATSATYDPPVITATTYYRVIVTNSIESLTCTDTSNCLTITVNPLPTATAAITNATCNGSMVNSNGTITISGFNTGEKYHYVQASTYTGSASYASGSMEIPAGGVIVNNLANPTAATDYSVRIFTSAECYVDRTVTLNPTSCACTNPVLTTLTDETICEGSMFTASNVTTSVSNGVAVDYQWSNNNGTDNPGTADISGQTTATLTATDLPTAVGSYSYRVTATNTADGTCTASEVVNLVIENQPEAGNQPMALTICESSTTSITLAEQLTGEDTGGTWTAGGSNPTGGTFNPATGTFDPTGAATGTYTFEYAFAAGTACLADNATVTINVSAQPEAGNQPMALTICESSTTSITLADQLTGEDTGGTWTAGGSNPTGGTFNPATGTFDPTGAATGTYTFEYAFAAGTACLADNATVTINVSAQPEAGNQPMALTICESSTTSITLADQLTGEDTGGTWTAGGSNPTGGTFNAATGTFDPTGAATGTYTFEYAFAAGTACLADNATVTINVSAQPEAGNQPMTLTICESSTTSITLADQLTGEDTGGTWTAGGSNPTGGTFNPATGTFDPTGAATGTYTFEYAFAAGTACLADNATVTINVSAQPEAGNQPMALTICESSTTSITLADQLTGEDTGGTWTAGGSNPTGGTFNAATGTFDPTGAATGTYTFEYAFAAGTACLADNATVTINVSAQPEAGNQPMALTICESSTTNITLADQLTGEDTGGTWTAGGSNPTGGTFNPATGTFDPTGAATGTYTFEYAFAAGTACLADNATVTINVSAQPEAGNQPMALTICESSTTSITLADQLTGEDTGGTWTAGGSNPTGGTFNAATGTFDPTGAATGTYTFEYAFAAANGCPADNAVVTIIISEQPTGGITPTHETCAELNNGGAMGGATGGTGPYNWIWSTTETTQSISGLTAGTYSLTVTDANGCMDTVTTTITQPDTLKASLTQVSDTCMAGVGSATIMALGGTSGYNYSWSGGGTNAMQTNLTAGKHYVTLTDANNCMVIDSVELANYCPDFDLALKKTVAITSGYTPGTDVDFEIKVYNQGEANATNVVVKDYIPEGLRLNDNGWLSLSEQVAVDTIASILAGDSATLTIRLRISSGFRSATGDLINNAEITSADGGVDSDSPLSNTNDGTTNELTTDNDVNDEAPNTPGTADNGADEDDYDAALINVDCPAQVCLPITIKQNGKE